MEEKLLSENPPTKLVSKFVNLLDISDIDYREENERHNVLGEVLQLIRCNKEIEEKIKNLDLKISLIVRNHLTIQDLMCQNKKATLTRVMSLKSKDLQVATKMQSSTCGIGYTKESHKLLEAYQQMFYLLQTDPRYMARFIVSMTPGFSIRFIESLVGTLYNCGSTPREECLMLQFFGLALKEEVRTRVDKFSDIATSGSIVLKMILNFYKAGSGLSSLKELLEPVVKMIVKDSSLYLSTDPAEVYKHWINEQETALGQVVQMPYGLPSDEAEKIPEVIQRIERSISSLETKSAIFVKRIVESGHLLPYGICYVTKVLHQCLTEKFPEATEIEIMKCVGQLFYYRYIIATIPAAETFGVILLKPGEFISTVQRKNLGTIAKVLQHAAAFQLFDPTCKLNVLNGFLLSCHREFLDFLKLVCSVEEPEACFNMDAYSEATLLRTPEITLYFQDIVMCHDLLRKHRKIVAPDPFDPLHQVLNDLGHPLVVEPDTANDLMTLCLASKFTAQTELPAMEHLLTVTEQLVVQFLQCYCEGETLLDMLRSNITIEEEQRFQKLFQNSNCKATSQMLSQFRNLSELKNGIMHKLVQLELADYVSSSNGYQKVINMIAKKIMNRNTYRGKRKMEIINLYSTLSKLKVKNKYLQETLDYYTQYIENCLRSVVKSQKEDDSKIKKKVVKCSGVKFAELGILNAVRDLETSQLRHIAFEISTTNIFGVFLVTVWFRSTAVEKVDVDIQHLLQLQYEGDTIVDMFGCAKININLLLYFLNRKFLAT